MASNFPTGVAIPGGASYVSPLLDFSPVGNLPDTVFRGQQQRQQVESQRAFRNGIPKLQDGSNDYGAMVNRLVQMGAYDDATKIVGIGAQQTGVNEVITNPESPYHRPGVTPTGAPTNTTQSYPNPPQQPPQPGQTGPRVTSPPPTTSEGTLARPNNEGGFDAPPSGPAYQEEPRMRAVLDQRAPPGVDNASVRRNLEKLIAAGESNPRLKGIATAAKLRLEHLYKEQESTPEQKNLRPGTGPGGKSAAQAMQDIKTEGANRELTPDEKNLRPSGFDDRFAAAGAGSGRPRSAAQMQTDIKTQGAVDTKSGELAVTDFAKEYNGLQHMEQASFNGLQKAQLGKNLINQPGFYSGPLEPTVRTFQQFRSIFGQNPASAQPNEAFGKVVNDMLTEQVKALGQSGVGRVLQVEVQNMQKAIASLGITPMSNRALLDLVERVYKQSQVLGGIAREVEHQNLPPQQKLGELHRRVSEFYQQNPLLTAQEKSDPRLIGLIEAPAQIKTPQQASAWARGMGIPPGYPVLWGGKIKMVP